ncbi:SHOCT domain-containing protein [Cellulomonas sp. Leaf395]|uniref:SHOCT domain-containing protein n=1 Tax=Cellulomonas sp. Leaf395 TaxID=1736362 RepID=UPI0006F4F2B1|nr:SHOCT domain-containing protein [Cellulomonas sp. Leaf395]KQS99720.1 hypothetical protein ASG23_10275 [Cellulomonas sp. Leaf395]
MPPASQGPPDDPGSDPLIDSAAQLAELADLVARGFLSPEEFELQRRKVFGDAETSPPLRKESPHD